MDNYHFPTMCVYINQTKTKGSTHMRCFIIECFVDIWTTTKSSSLIENSHLLQFLVLTRYVLYSAFDYLVSWFSHLLLCIAWFFVWYQNFNQKCNFFFFLLDLDSAEGNPFDCLRIGCVLYSDEMKWVSIKFVSILVAICIAQ